MQLTLIDNCRQSGKVIVVVQSNAPIVQTGGFCPPPKKLFAITYADAMSRAANARLEFIRC